MSGHTVGVTVWRGAASTVRLRADTDSKLASDIKLKVRGAQRASSPPILDVTNQTTNVSRCLLPQQGCNIEFDIHCRSAFDTNHRSVPQQSNRSVLPPRGAQAQWPIWPHLPAVSRHAPLTTLASSALHSRMTSLLQPSPSATSPRLVLMSCRTRSSKCDNCGGAISCSLT